MILELEVKFAHDRQTYELVVTPAGATRLDRVTASGGIKPVAVTGLANTLLGERVRLIVQDTKPLFEWSAL